MMIARWSIEAKFGHKQTVLDMLNSWNQTIAPQAGFDPKNTRLYTGSIGTLESTVQSEHPISNLSELDQVWDKLSKIEDHKRWGKELEPYIVSGTSRWEVYRVLS